MSNTDHFTICASLCPQGTPVGFGLLSVTLTTHTGGKEIHSGKFGDLTEVPTKRVAKLEPPGDLLTLRPRLLPDVMAFHPLNGPDPARQGRVSLPDKWKNLSS